MYRLLKILLILSFIISYCLYPQQDELRQQLIKLNQIVKVANEKHISEIEARELIDAAIKGLIQKLDPHSKYFTPEEVKLIEQRRKGITYSLGLSYQIINDTLTILSVLEGGPAFKAGLRTGDKILQINKESLISKKEEQLELLLNTEYEVNLNLVFQKYNSNKLNNITIRTQKLPIYSVDASFIIDGTDIGYISVNRFMTKTHNEITDTLLSLMKKGMQKLIIDLRGNPGGVLDETYLTIDEFIPENNIILMTRGRDPNYNETYRSSAGGKFENLPLVVIVDKESASASEIFAGAIQDLDRGIIIGETTFGKGLVQRPYQFYDGSELWLTVAQYYTPSGRSIQKPYENNPNYGTLQDRIVLKDGLNLSHTVEVLPEFANNVYRTKNGRTVIGSGGITPDYIINQDTLTKISEKIINSNAFYKYIIEYYKKYEQELKTLYYNDFKYFLNNFDIDDIEYCDFVNYINSNGIECEINEISKDTSIIKTLLKANLAKIIWDDTKMKQVLVDSSIYLKKAIEMVPVAEQIIKKK